MFSGALLQLVALWSLEMRKYIDLIDARNTKIWKQSNKSFLRAEPDRTDELNWQFCLAGGAKTAPRILILSIAMGADYSFYVKSIATYAPAFLRYNNSVLARVFQPIILRPTVFGTQTYKHMYMYDFLIFFGSFSSLIGL